MARQLIVFNETNNRILELYPQGGFSEPDYKGRTDVIFDPEGLDDLLERAIPQYYMLADYPGTLVREMSQEEKDEYDAEQAAIKVLESKPAADLLIAKQVLQDDLTVQKSIKDYVSALMTYLGI